MTDVQAWLGTVDDALVLKLAGPITYVVAPALDALVDEMLRSSFATVIVDLTACERIDSTGLGLVARIGAFTLDWRGRRAVIACAPGDIATALESVCFDQVFDIVGMPPAPASLREVVGAPSARGLGEVIVDAHKELMAINEHNRRLFADAVAALERELERS